MSLTNLLLIPILLIIAFVDFKRHIIYNSTTLVGISVGILLNWKLGLIGALTGLVSLYLIGILGQFIFHSETLGGGDVKLLAMLGAFLGWKPVLLVFFIAPIFGIMLGSIIKKDKIPYGVAIVLAAITVILYGEKLIKFLS